MTTEPPYLRIAGEIRRRIASGELAPGDPVPSTRRITQEWGVAMATATKALGALNQEGLVRPVPGIGTVVAESGRERATPQARQPQLSRERVIRTAIALADAEGLAALSMRRLATEFGTSTMALYRHVPSKGELVRLMSEAVFGSGPPDPRPTGWRPLLEQEARWLWKQYAQHPWLARAMAGLTRPTASPNAMRYTERVLTALTGLGLTPEQMLHIHLTVLGYAQGIAMAVELESQARQDSGMTADEWMTAVEPRMDAIQTTTSYPVLSTLFDEGSFELDLHTLFEFGLGRVLDGVEVLVAGTGPRHASNP
ncbi:TetR/AcrR family transcriptional regulator C-terminal domain-containing protein [Streptomyces sp. NPDC048511]|uniref:TetR/AcrR family transcriptional regulator C-terminal domain-containing protein n=1 Tax=Streptomyces sp. NPDC048511 TaxID=3365562 RepID=UPI00370F9898